MARDSKQMFTIESERIQESVLSGMKELYETGNLFDMELEDNDGYTIQAHSCMLASVCPLIRNFLTRSKQRRIRVTEVCINDWQFILDFIYLGKIEVPLNMMEGLYEAVTALKIEILIELMKDAMHQVKVASKKRITHVSDKSDFYVVKGPYATITIDPHASDEEKMAQLNRAFHESADAVNLKYTSGSAIKDVPETVDKSDLKEKQKLIEEVTEAVEVEYLLAIDHLRNRSEDDKPDEPTVFRCADCDVEIRYGPELLEHERKFHDSDVVGPVPEVKPDPTFCRKCGKKFDTSAKLKKHVCDRKSKCPYCPLRFPFKYVIDIHISKFHPNEAKTHFKEKVECTYCHKECFSADYLRWHIKHMCSVRRLRGALESHKTNLGTPIKKRKKEQNVTQSMSHDEDMMMRTCLICEKDVNGLGKHAQEEHNVELFLCDSCPQAFYGQLLLDSHYKLMHVPTKCLYCQVMFQNKKSVHHHMSTCADADAEGRKKWYREVIKDLALEKEPQGVQCGVCKTHFPTVQWLSRHYQISHGLQAQAANKTDAKPHCHICDRTFSAFRSLRDHLMRHYSIKPYQCDRCDYSCSNRGDLYSHQRSSHGEGSFSEQCPICLLTFTSASKYLAHGKKKHKQIFTIESKEPGESQIEVKDYDLEKMRAELKEMYASTKRKDPHLCVICNQPCSNRVNLNNHGIVIHKISFAKVVAGLDNPYETRESSKKQKNTSPGDKPAKKRKVDSKHVIEITEYQEQLNTPGGNAKTEAKTSKSENLMQLKSTVDQATGLSLLTQETNDAVEALASMEKQYNATMLVDSQYSMPQSMNQTSQPFATSMTGNQAFGSANTPFPVSLHTATPTAKNQPISLVNQSVTPKSAYQQTAIQSMTNKTTNQNAGSLISTPNQQNQQQAKTVRVGGVQASTPAPSSQPLKVFRTSDNELVTSEGVKLIKTTNATTGKVIYLIPK